MRVKFFRNLSAQLVHDLSRPSLQLPAETEGRVVEVAEDVGERLLAEGLAEETEDDVTYHPPRRGKAAPAAPAAPAKEVHADTKDDTPSREPKGEAKGHEPRGRK